MEGHSAIQVHFKRKAPLRSVEDAALLSLCGHCLEHKLDHHNFHVQILQDGLLVTLFTDSMDGEVISQLTEAIASLAEDLKRCLPRSIEYFKRFLSEELNRENAYFKKVFPYDAFDQLGMLAFLERLQAGSWNHFIQQHAVNQNFRNIFLNLTYYLKVPKGTFTETWRPHVDRLLPRQSFHNYFDGLNLWPSIPPMPSRGTFFFNLFFGFTSFFLSILGTHIMITNKILKGMEFFWICKIKL